MYIHIYIAIIIVVVLVITIICKIYIICCSKGIYVCVGLYLDFVSWAANTIGWGILLNDFILLRTVSTLVMHFFPRIPDPAIKHLRHCCNL